MCYRVMRSLPSQDKIKDKLGLLELRAGLLLKIPGRSGNAEANFRCCLLPPFIAWLVSSFYALHSTVSCKWTEGCEHHGKLSAVLSGMHISVSRALTACHTACMAYVKALTVSAVTAGSC